MRIVVLVASAALVATACVREGTPVVAAVEANDNPDAGAAAIVVAAPPPPPASESCTARLRAQPIATQNNCTLDERISKKNGVLFYPCSGQGPFEAVFSEHHFQGTLSGNTLELTLTTELDWEDNCHWETHQRIRGPFRIDAKSHPKLTWSYTEAPVQGTNCLGSCTARADIEIDQLSTDKRDTPKPATD